MSKIRWKSEIVEEDRKIESRILMITCDLCRNEEMFSFSSSGIDPCLYCGESFFEDATASALLSALMLGGWDTFFRVAGGMDLLESEYLCESE